MDVEPRLPFKTPFFFGWIVLVTGIITMVMASSSQTYTIAVFIDDFVRDLDLSRSTVSLLYGLATLASAIILPYVGRQIDRRGPRLVTVWSSFALGLVCVAISKVNGLVSLLLGFMLLRMLGTGILQMTSTNVIAQWFVRKRGFVMGLAGFSLSATLVFYPSLAHELTLLFSWRGAWIVLGLLTWIVLLPTTWLLLRDKPEDFDLLPDNDAPVSSWARSDDTQEEKEIGIDWTLAEARRTGSFWLFAVAEFTFAMVGAGLFFHQLSLFSERGLASEAALSAFQYTGGIAAVSVLLIGWMLDYFDVRTILVVAMSSLAIAMLTARFMTRTEHALLFSATLGFETGCFLAVRAVVWPNYYGRRYLGAIRGAVMPLRIAGAALGPYTLGLSLDYLGSYGPALIGQLVLPAGIILAALIVTKPRRH